MRRVAYIYKMLQIIGNAYKLPGKERKGKKKQDTQEGEEDGPGSGL